MNWLKSLWQPVFRLQLQPAEFSNFTPRAQQALALACKEATRLNHNFVGTEHLLLGLVSIEQSTAVAVLRSMGASPESVRQEVEQQIGRGPGEIVTGLIPYTPRVKKALALAAKESAALKHSYVGTEHLLLGLLRERDGVAARVLKNLGLDIELLRQNILRGLDPNYSSQPEDTAMQGKPSSHAQCELIDISRRYDVYSREGDQDVVYRNALFKGVRTLFKQKEYDVLSEYLELEQADGQTVYIARTSVIKFCKHGQTPGPEIQSGNRA